MNRNNTIKIRVSDDEKASILKCAEKARMNISTYIRNSALQDKEDGVIDFSKDARTVCCLVRGFCSWPTASTVYAGQVMKVHMAREAGRLSDICPGGAAPGTVVKADKTGLYVACGGDTAAVLTNIQMPGKKAMDVSAWLLGNRIEIGTVLG